MSQTWTEPRVALARRASTRLRNRLPSLLGRHRSAEEGRLSEPPLLRSILEGGCKLLIVTEERLKPLANNLTLVRLCLASAVIWTHTWWRIHGISGVDEFSGFIGQPVSYLAVDGFFFLSGFLVYRSLVRSSRIFSFAIARLARLWPGLAVSVLLTVAVGIFLTQAHGLSYLKGQTARFVLSNLSLIFGSYSLQGVYCGKGLCVVNGSLWTITWEARFYLLLAILGVTGLARPTVMKWLIIPTSVAFALAIHLPTLHALVEKRLGSGALYNVMILDRLWTMFMLGMATYLWRERIVLSWTILAFLLVAAGVSAHFTMVPHVESVCLGYAVLCAGFLTARSRAISGHWPDYSYGIYIYAFPAMMLVAGALRTTSHAWLALATLAATLPLAALSWHLIERPVLDYVRNLRSRSTGEKPAEMPEFAGGLEH